MMDRHRMMQCRMLAGMTQARAEAEAGLPTGSVSRFERGIARPGYDDVAALAEVYGVTVPQLVGKDDLVLKRTT